MSHRPWPALALFVLSPLIAEYLLGSLSFAQLNALPVMCLMYGGGAVLIRELARASGRGWPAILLVGLAYALIEEGLVTQSLFNPNYIGLRLLDYGYLPALGTALPWSVYVLSLHVVWSVCVPITLVEALFPARAATPWLAAAGRVTFGVLFLVGAAVIAAFSYKGGHFIANPLQLGAVVVMVVALVVMALRPPATMVAASPGSAPPAYVLLLTTFVLGSLWSLAQGFKQAGVAWPLTVLAMLALEATAFLMIRTWSRRAHWSAQHAFAAGAGALLVYGWFGYTVEIALHGKAALVPHSALVILIVALTGIAALRVYKREEST